MPGEGFFIDHVIYGAVDIDATAARLRRDYGLGSVPGGNHLGGTTNRIVPLSSSTFFEQLGIGDTSRSDGAWLAETLQGRDHVLWWVLGVDDLDETARRRGLPIQLGTMEMSEGTTTSFRTAGMPRYPLPFFVAYDMSREARAQVWERRTRAAQHECTPGTFTFVEVGESAERMYAWLGDHQLPVRHTLSAQHGITRVGIATDRGEVILE